MNENYLEQRTQPTVWFRAPENVQSDGEATCNVCGLEIKPGEVIAEMDSEYGMEFCHADCAEEAGQ